MQANDTLSYREGGRRTRGSYGTRVSVLLTSTDLISRNDCLSFSRGSMINIAADLGDFLPGGKAKFLAPGAATHICGTTRAGKEDDGHSIVDRNSKVWRLENLFIGGCGVIPTQNACNPTLTAACFAIVGARKVVQEIHALRGQQYQSKL